MDLFETHIDVSDLDRSVEFYTAVLGLELAIRRQVDGASGDAHTRGARRFALLWVGGRGHAMLGLWERPGETIRTQHFAFELGLDELPAKVAELERRGVALRDFFQRRTTTPSVFGFIPAASIYFDDPMAMFWSCWHRSLPLHGPTWRRCHGATGCGPLKEPADAGETTRPRVGHDLGPSPDHRVTTTRSIARWVATALIVALSA